MGAEQADIVLSPDRIESYRVDGKAPNGLALDGYAVTATGPLLDATQQEKIIKLVGNVPAFGESKKNCGFFPGIGLRFVKGDRQVVLLMCFKCEDWGFITSGDRLAIADFSNPAIQSRLVFLAKSLFPKDQQIQSLTAKVYDPPRDGK